MKQLSHWAKTNRWKAILAIVLIQILLASIYFYGGIYLFAAGYQFSEFTVLFSGSLILLANVCYPIKGTQFGFFRYKYLKAKLWQGVILLGTLIFVMNAGNQLARSSMITSTDVTIEARQVVLDVKPSSRMNKKKLKKQRRLSRKNMKRKFRSMVKDIRKQGNTNFGDVMGFLLLALLFTALFGYAVLALYCNLACSGATGAAIMVLIGGILLWLFGLTKIFRWIFKRKVIISDENDKRINMKKQG